MKNSLAIAYAMKRKSDKKKMAEGGEVKPTPSPQPEPIDKSAATDVQKSFSKALGFAEGGDVGCPHCGGFIGSEQSAGKPEVDLMVDQDGGDMVGKIMKMSKGGQVANNDHAFESDFEDPNEFDDLVLRDNDMEGADYTGANSGDKIGCEGEDERRSDIVSKIMSSRKKKDRNPRPA